MTENLTYGEMNYVKLEAIKTTCKARAGKYCSISNALCKVTVEDCFKLQMIKELKEMG